MRKLISFLINHSPIFVYAFYLVICFVLLFKFNPYQQSVFFSSANEMAGRFYIMTSGITGYFGLQEINRDLQKQNGNLEMELIRLRDEVSRLSGDSLLVRTSADSSLSRYDFQIAQVINNSVFKTHNYITLNKGRKDGIHSEMGVIDQNGIVGIVNVVSDHYAVAISLLNPKLRLSCKVKGSNYFGSLVWDGKDPRFAVLEELPRHVKFVKGDTIVTSGYSSVFPEGLMVGTVDGFSKQRNDNFYALTVKLSTDFFRLNDVRILDDKGQKERRILEMEAKKDE
ncbi:rod shape-determining protein MreC [Coprobacter fastidiosus]|jgi:rod shape-determining protein MreC|uniref:Cell shape-determining protein MreC n=1 Tax=Coprobacter fastidiosus NSB1 = JCM 33896 TaxID=1349822 RepID=A0A495VMI8_9BACT|nr:rod shape-determining protein MreC [Coprobacter fastidiosus]ERM88685.1 rod shape-determining protein MreC [Coprobacter fastidiosus NSB1 = JCM 33896]RHS45704.1 rod shape-determining protein MreC [Tannerella sp. AF04-6]RKT50596.1 rod shape-determining protein MreC [Coprobacter fastidiosus NSB1 = JCM 33896]BEG63554.1 rod shape-determining protein MreC [Coprobacter fastidiosus]